MKPPRRARFRSCAGFCLAFVALPAAAQWSASIAAESDYRLRGVSLSDGRPSLRATLNVDAPGGAYGGASATSVRFGDDDRYAQLLAYGGVVLDRGIDLGASVSHFTGERRYDYLELNAGLLGERWSLRAAFSPNYFGLHRRTLYIEANGHHMLAARLRLFAHAGALLPLGGEGTRRRRADVRAGFGWTIADADLQLAWAGATRGGPYPNTTHGKSAAWVIGASWAF